MENSGDLVRIRVKSASHRCEDLEISCPLDSTVRNVKEIIKDQYPLHPEIKEQRIIYAGQLLEDDQILREIFAHGGQVSVSGGYTFHLACNSTFLRKTTTTNETAEGDSKPKMDQTNSGDCDVHGRVPPPQNLPAGIPHDMLALHQLYVEQMMHFMSQWNQGTMAPVWLPAPTPPMMHGMHVPQELPHNLRQLPVHHQLFNQPNLEQQQPVLVQPPPAPRVVNDDDEPQRDLLDWIYTASRLCLILSVVYFYSNFTRFVLVLLFTALVMLAQRRPGLLNAFRYPPQPAPQQQEQPQQRNENNNPEGAAGEGQAAPNPDGEGQAEVDGNTEGGAPSPPEELIPAQVQQQQRFLDIARTFVMTFVTSLIPEMNP